MKTIIAGSRSIKEYHIVAGIIDNLPWTITEVISGAAPGVDTVGANWAINRRIPLISMPADWDTHGKAAGYIRNEKMAKEADACLIIWDGISKGSKHMIDIAVKQGLHLCVVNLGRGYNV